MAVGFYPPWPFGAENNLNNFIAELIKIRNNAPIVGMTPMVTKIQKDKKMSKIKSSDKQKPEGYLRFSQDRAKLNETNDCTVVATAAVCGISYEEAHAACAKFGRKARKGMKRPQYLEAIKSLGFVVETVSMRDIIAKYPGNHKNLKSITTHHPARFNNVWRDGNNYLLNQKAHVSACVNGELHDWAVGRMKRVIFAYKVTKIGGGTPMVPQNQAQSYLAKVTRMANA